MSRAVSVLFALLVAISAGPAAASPVVASSLAAAADGEGVIGPDARPNPKDRWIVVYHDGADVKAANARAKRRGVDPDRTYKHALKGYAAKLTAGQLADVKADPAVAYVARDGIVTLQGQTTPRGVRRIDAPRNRVAKIDGTDERVDADVAIFDTGIDRSHPDLNVVGGYNCSSSNTAAWGDGNGHGTHVAGTVGAIDNGAGVVGVAPGVRLWAVRILDSSGAGLVSWYVCGMDWIAAQRDPNDATRPLIEAVNMSVAKSGSDDRNCGYTNKDAMHQAICRLVASGVTVVAAAGNNSFNASRLIPASYNEVITVSALADTDGKPGGLGGNSCYSWGTYDKDDTFADFSNYGADVDIMAPGKCIWSTMPGNRYAYMSGTSMAAPHVTGAAALWLASRPGRTPTEVKDALRALATLDWKTSTDPDGNPDPLLDTAHLLALGDFTVDATQPGGYVNKGGTTLTVPVALYRAEDFAADVSLAASPDQPLLAAFDTKVLTGSTTTAALTVTVPKATPTGIYKIRVSASDGTRARNITVNVRVDADAPTVGTPTLAVARASTFNTTSFAGQGRWPAASDALTGIAAYQASWRVDGGSWATTTLDDAVRLVSRTLHTGHTYDLRVRAKDGAGNWSGWVAASGFRALVTQDSHSSLARTGTWSVSSSVQWSRSTAISSKTARSTVTKGFTGRAVAWVGAFGTSRGQAKVYIDGVLAETVDLHRSSTTFRRVAFSRGWTTSAAHTIRIVVVGTAGHPRVDVDAILVIR